MATGLHHIRIEDYTYALPDERIAKEPAPERDQSRLLVYRDGQVTHAKFKDIISFLPSNATLFFNDTRVIPARLLFTKDTGAAIEIFLLAPVSPATLLQQAMAATGSVTWKCAVGNLKRWPDEMTLLLTTPGFTLSADLINRSEGLVRLSWSPADLSFAEVVEVTGVTPLPPYIPRDAAPEDKARYQTVYAAHAGAVAAPTAGLHFSEHVLEELQKAGIQQEFLTLHVSAGTFQPVKAIHAADHPMHAEQVIVTRHNIERLLTRDRTVVAVGTTSMRTLESIYWYGVKLLSDPQAGFTIGKMEPYLDRLLPTRQESLQAVRARMDQLRTDQLVGETSIFILPGYEFRMCDVMITNFHQPGSTLMLLVAAFVGEDWKSIYQEALQHDYRFLSYGDSSLLFRTVH